MGILREFRICNCGLDHDEPQRFVTSQWGRPRFYMSWRIFWAFFHTSWLIISLVTLSTLGVAVWFIYFTHWAYLLLTISAVLDAVNVVFVTINRHDIIQGFTSHLPWYLKVSWLLNSFVTESSLHVSVVYWGFLAKDQRLTLLTFIHHGMNSIYILSNLLVIAMPVRVYHMIYPVILGVIFSVFSALCQILGKGNPYIYKILDWSNLKWTVPFVLLGDFVAIPSLHLVVFFIHKLRIYVHSKCLTSSEDTPLLESSTESSDCERTGV